MTKISNQIVYIPDLEINGLDYFIGTDYDQNKRTVNFRVEDLGSHYNMTNGIRNFEYIFYEHTNISPTPTDGYFYSNDNETNPNNIEYFIFSKKTARDKDVTQFFQSIISDNPFDLIVSQKTGINTTFFFRIDEIIENANYFRLNVSEVFFPENNSLSYVFSHAVFNLKSIGNPISQEIRDGVTSKAPSEDVVYDKLLLKQNLPTGFITGLELSINILDNTKFDISPGAYSITDFTDLQNITVKIIQIPLGITGITPQYLTSNTATYIAIDSDQTIVHSSSPFDNEDRRTLAILGAVIHSNLTTINVTNEIKAPIIAPTNQLHDLIKAVGYLNLEGNVYSPNGANLSINKTAGKIWGLGINSQNYNDPHRLTLIEQIALSFRYRLRDVSLLNGEGTDTTFIDPNNYDLNGVKTTVPNNRFTIQRINLFQSGLTRIQYGQEVYQNLEEAKTLVQTDPFFTEQNISDNAIFRAYLIVKKGITNLTTAVSSGDAQFIPVDKFGNVVGGAGIVLNFDNITTGLGYVPENVSNKQNSLVADILNIKYPTVTAVNSGLSSKQDTLISGTNIKTINGNSLLGSGNLSIQNINTVKTITSSSLSTQDITGFLTYLNAVTSFSIGLNETVDYHVTDTNQYFKILVNGVSVGSGQTAIVESQVITYDLNTMAKFKGALYLWQPIGNQISVVGAVTPTTVGTGSNATSNFSGTYTSSPALTWNRRRSVSAASAGSTAEFYEAGWHVCSVGLGFYFVAQVQSELNPSNARLFDGLTNSLIAFPNSDPSSQINLLGLGKDAADTNYHIIHNDGTGTATKVLLTGSNFLASNLDSFRIEIINLYNSNTVTFIITNLRTRGVSLVNVNSDLPSITTGLAPRLSSNNGSTAASVTKSWNKLEIRTNN